MARPIDADKLLHEIEELCPEFGNEDSSFVERGEVLDIIAEQEEVDAVKVVRCKDCARPKEEEPGMALCPLILGGWVGNNEFCSRGVRRYTDGNS